MPATRASRTRWVTVVAVTLLVLSLPFIAAKAYVALKPDPRPPSSFDNPIGPLDARMVPNGWAPYIEAASRESGVPAPVLAAQLEAESKWDPQARSSVGAQGLAQFMPDTWETYGRGGDVYDPKDAIAAQGRFMKHLLEQSRNSGYDRHPYELALAGYNAGFGAVQKFKDIPPYPETEDYVVRIRDRTAHYAQRLATPSGGSSAGTSSGSAQALPVRREGS